MSNEYTQYIPMQHAAYSSREAQSQSPIGIVLKFLTGRTRRRHTDTAHSTHSGRARCAGAPRWCLGECAFRLPMVSPRSNLITLLLTFNSCCIRVVVVVVVVLIGRTLNNLRVNPFVSKGQGFFFSPSP